MLASGVTSWWAFDRQFRSFKKLPILPSGVCFASGDKKSVFAGTHLYVSCTMMVLLFGGMNWYQRTGSRVLLWSIKSDFFFFIHHLWHLCFCCWWHWSGRLRGVGTFLAMVSSSLAHGFSTCQRALSKWGRSLKKNIFLEHFLKTQINQALNLLLVSAC